MPFLQNASFSKRFLAQVNRRGEPVFPINIHLEMKNGLKTSQLRPHRCLSPSG